MGPKTTAKMSPADDLSDSPRRLRLLSVTFGAGVVIEMNRVFHRQPRDGARHPQPSAAGSTDIGLSYTCLPAHRSRHARSRPSSTRRLIPAARPVSTSPTRMPLQSIHDASRRPSCRRSGLARAADGATVKEGSYLSNRSGRTPLARWSTASSRPVARSRKAAVQGGPDQPQGGEGHPRPNGRSATPLRDVLRAQVDGKPVGADQQVQASAAPTQTSSATTGRSTTRPSSVHADRCRDRRRAGAAPAPQPGPRSPTIPDCWLVASDRALRRR